jgi:hypothetical protein
MTTVHTVLGPVETADLGFTLSHEQHVGTPPACVIRTRILDREGFLSKQWQPCARHTRQACGRWSMSTLTWPRYWPDSGSSTQGPAHCRHRQPSGCARPFGRSRRCHRAPIREIEEGIEGTDQPASSRLPVPGRITPPEVVLRAAARRTSALVSDYNPYLVS